SAISSTAPGLPTWAMIANRRGSGTTSRNSSRRLPARSVDWRDRPVMLPPGRDRLATKPLPTGSFAMANTIGMTDVACFCREACGSRSDNDIPFPLDEPGSDLDEPLVASLAPSILDCDGATLDPAEVAQSLHKSGDPLAPG